MKFTAYLPPKSLTGEKCPALIWLTGKTLGEFGFTNKSGFQRFASKYGMIVFAPEPTPRGIEKPLPDGSLEYGAQVGQYLGKSEKISEYGCKSLFFRRNNTEMEGTLPNVFLCD